MMKISVIGLGKLGLPLATTIASKDFFVYGIDINKKIVENLNQGLTDLAEPNLASLLKKYKSNILATTESKNAILDSSITFIITPTPSQKNGSFSLQYINPVVKEIARVLRLKESYHLVVIVSTVMPQSMNKIKKTLEKISGKKSTKDFGLCYNPEFIALGSVIYNLLNPDFVLIGESDKKAGDALQTFYKKYCDNKSEIARMSFVNAELTKISLNTYITTKISYANMLAEVCERLPGGNVDVVTEAIGLDSRVGKKYLKGGSAFGGPCFPRDNIAFISLAKKLKSTFSIPKATHKTNLRQLDRLTEKVMQYWRKGKKVAILGISYKPFTDVVEESPGLLLAQVLIGKNIPINLHDPLALRNIEKILKGKANYMDSLKECIEKSQILVLTTLWPEYEEIKASWYANGSKVLIDPWRMIDVTKLPENVTYAPLGLNV